jgi:hypothetical protein
MIKNSQTGILFLLGYRRGTDEYEIKIPTKMVYKVGSHRLSKISSEYIKNHIRMFIKLRSIELCGFEINTVGKKMLGRFVVK